MKSLLNGIKKVKIYNLEREIFFMAIEIKRKNNETNESLLRRFQDKIKRSRVLIVAKKKRYFEKEKTKRARREEAKARKEFRAKRDYLIRIGKMPEIVPGKRGNFKKK
jgi:ribosomal protein S21